MQQLTIDPAAPFRAQESYELGTIVRESRPASRGLPGEFSDLLSGHPTGVGWSRIDHVRSDSEVTKFLRCCHHNSVERPCLRRREGYPQRDRW